MRPAVLVVVFIGFLALWAVLGILIRTGLRSVSAHPRQRGWRAMLCERYSEWGEDFVTFLVYWLGAALFMAVLATVFLVSGHLGWFLFAIAAALFALLGIAAAVKHGKATPRNILRFLTRS